MWVKENTVLNLSCEASGHPRPSISWSVDGTVSPPHAPHAPHAPLPQALLPGPDLAPELRLLPYRPMNKTKIRRAS